MLLALFLFTLCGTPAAGPAGDSVSCSDLKVPKKREASGGPTR